MTFGGEELYPTIVEKAAALGYSLIQNHPFLDGNKRTGHAAMEVSTSAASVQHSLRRPEKAETLEMFFHDRHKCAE
jgi:hypothetical protein